MSLIRPFAALHPATDRAAEVIAPPYDVLNSDEAKILAKGKPWSFLHISKAEIDLPQGTDVHSDEVYHKAAENLRHMIDAGVIERETSPVYYAYRLIMDDHEQTGLVATASVSAYDANIIKRHEFTRPDKEDDRVRQIEALNAQTGPVLLVYPDAPTVDRMIAAACMGTPDADAVADSGVRHTVWAIRDPVAIAELTQAFELMPALYIADGHHRSAAASRVAAARHVAGVESNSDYFLAVIFPRQQMRIMDYNRVIRGLNGLSVDQFLSRLANDFIVEAASGAVRPTQQGEFGLYLEGRWHNLQIRPNRVPADPVGRLDVSILQNRLIGPILGVTDPRRDTRIDFVGGIRGLAELVRRVDSGEMTLALSMYPTPMTDLMAVADSGEVMPPKSTWFEPKLADGLASHIID
ncbi:MAG: DUF1015 domain-containing protein [Methylococcaceae bacterium]|jgi:uncharacterized protein (DUF1015 family)